MQSNDSSNTPKKSTRTGRRFLIRFENEAELRKVRRAASKAQVGLKKQMGKKFPNTSLFIAESALEKADKVLEQE